MRLLLLLTVVVCANAVNPAAILAIAAKAKVAEEVAGGVGDILKNLGDLVSNSKEDIADKETASSGNLGVLLDILQKINNGEIKVSKRELIPERDELLERLGKLYDRIRAYVNGGAEVGMEAFETALEQIKVTYERFKQFKSLSWLKRWIDQALKKIEEKLDEYESTRTLSDDVEKRDLIPTRDELSERLAQLYDRVRAYINGGAEVGMMMFEDALAQLQTTLDRLSGLNYLSWIRKWVAIGIQKIEEKLDQYDSEHEEDLEKRELIPTRDELAERLARLYDRVRAYINGGAEVGAKAFEEALDQIKITLERFRGLKSLSWLRRWIASAIKKIEEKFDEYEAERDQEKRELIPTRDELAERLAKLYDRVRAYINGGAEIGMMAFEEALDQIKTTVERLRGLKSLSWLRRWIASAIERIEQKLDQYDSERTLEDDVEKRALIPTREELAEKLARLYDRVRAYINGGAEVGARAFEETLDQIKISLERFDGLKSLSWLRRWIAEGIQKIEEKMDQYEKERNAHVERRDVLPPSDEVVEKIEALYDRIRLLVNDKADDALDLYKGLLDQAREAYEKVQRFKSLGWLKRWVVSILNKIDEKLQEYSEKLGNPEKRDLIPTREELGDRLARLYDRFRAYANAGMDTAAEAFKESLDFIRYLIQRFQQVRGLDWFKKWIAVLIEKAERNLEDLESGIERRDLVPTKDEVLVKLGELYDRLRVYLNGKADTLLDQYKGVLDTIREAYERFEKFKSLGWLKRWAVTAINAVEAKLNDYERSLDNNKRSSDLVKRDRAPGILKAWKKFKDDLEDFKTWTREKFDKLPHALASALTKLYFELYGHWPAAIKRSADLVKRDRAPGILKAWKKIKDDLKDFKTWTREKFDKLPHKLSSALYKLYYKLYGHWPAAIKRSAELDAHMERFHEIYRRDLTANLEQHFDSRTARGLGDTISDFFKDKWNDIKESFHDFTGNTKDSWDELMEEVKPILANVQGRGSQLLDDTKEAALLVRESAIKTIDETIQKMLATANDAILDGKQVVDLLKSHLEKFANNL